MNPYTFHINLYDLAFLGAVFIGLTFALLFWFTKRIDQSAKLHRILAGFGLLWLIWIPVIIIDYFYHPQLSIQAYCLLYFFLAVIITWIAINVFKPDTKQDELVSFSDPLPIELIKKGKWLKKAMQADLLYQDPELSLSSLAEKLDMHPHELSRIINKALGKSFNDFVNEYRVRDVVSKMQDPAYARITLLGMAYDAGFNSKATLIRAFKQFTGKNPTEYKRKLEKEVATYHLQPHSRARQIILVPEVPKWSHEQLNRNYMFRNYFKIAWRNLWLHKRMTFINIAGLGIGMAAAILIAIWVQNELSYDSDQPDAENIYRVTSIWPMSPTETWRLNSSQYVLADAAAKEIPEILDVSQSRPKDYANTNFHIGQKIVQEKKVTRVDDHWFKMFHYDFVDGSAAAFNKNLYSLILTQSAVKKFFGNEEAVGKMVRIDKTTYQVEGVVKDNPANTSFDYEVFIPVAAHLADTAELKDAMNWGNSNFLTFLKLKPGADIKKVAAQLTAIEHRNRKDKTTKDRSSYDLINIRNMHFEEGLLSYSFKHGSRTITNVFIALSVLLLLTACINYVNLTTARASVRSKEVSIRKIVGAGRLQLFWQFMSESFMMSLIAVALSFALVQLCMPWFKEFTGKNFSEPVFSPLAWQIVGITLIVSFVLNGLYPALLLSSFQPLRVFRGKTMLNFKDSGLRKALVVVQFTISVVLIVGALVIYRQLRYIENTDVGYDRSQVFTVDIPHNAPLIAAVLKQELKEYSAVADISLGKYLVDDGNKATHTIDWDGRPKDFNPTFTPFSADEDFQRVMKLKMVDGRWFTGAASDKHNVVLNETALRVTGLHKPYIGQRFVHFRDTGIVIGVVKDFHYASLHDQIGPVVITNDENYFYAYIKTTSGHSRAAVAAARRAMQKFAPDEPFEYHFVDDDYNKLYQSEQQSSVLIGLFAGIAILVSALGLMGLAAFAAEQKVKEIGIRKVLGASVLHIVSLLSVDFVKMVIIASVIAFPIAWWAMNKWLQDFAYKINLSWWIFAVSGAAALIIALITISYQTIKAALTNPVKSLRSE
ncbi:MAG TPA: ABC transporter permease [Mucilaginibacter sp.]